MLSKLSKLKKVSRAEFVERSKQGAKIIIERAKLGKKRITLSDKAFIGLFGDSIQNETDFVSDFRRKAVENPIFKGFSNREKTLSVLTDYFPRHRQFIIEKADRIVEGKFDLLGCGNLSFGTIPRWHFDPISQKESPKIHWSRIEEVNPAQTGDKKIIWELNRHQYFAILGQAYFYTNDEKYARTFAAHIKNWLAENPPKLGVNWLSSLELAFRSISWLWSLHFFINSESLSDSLFLKIIKTLYLQAIHIENYLSTYFSPNTHLTGEALGLILTGEFLCKLPKARRWREKGSQILFEEFDKQVRNDGTHVEQSTHYHRYTTEFYLHFLMFLRRSNAMIPPNFEAKLQKMCDFVKFAASPDGTTELVADDDGGRFLFLDEIEPQDFRPVLALAAVLCERPDFAFAAMKPSAELLWLCGEEGLTKFEKAGKVAPQEKIKIFPDGGFCAMRDAWTDKADFMLIDGGTHGFLNGGHAHADALHFVASIGGKRIFIDSGTYNYTSDAEARKYFRSTAAHNCLTIDGESSSISDGAFSWKTMTDAEILEFSETENSAVFRAAHDGFKHLEVDYERIFEFLFGNGFTVTEQIFSRYERDFALYFHIAPEAQIKRDFSLSVTVKSADETKVLQPIIEKCDISPRYGAKTAARKLVYKYRGKGKISLQTRFGKV